MKILKDDSMLINSINAKLTKIKHSDFTHELNVKSHYASENQSNYLITELIEDVFDPLSNVYTLSDGCVDHEGESGWSTSATIDDIQFIKLEVLDSKHFSVFYRLKLSNEKSETY